MPPSKAKQAAVALRRREMLVMKIQGLTALEIAEHYGMSADTARSDLSRAIKKAKELEVHEAGMYRFIQGARLEQLLKGIWDDAVTGDLKAGEQARRYIADISELFGLKVPVRTEISGPDGGAIPFSSGETAEVMALIDISDRDNAEIPALGTDDEDEEEEEEGDEVPVYEEGEDEDHGGDTDG